MGSTEQNGKKRPYANENEVLKKYMKQNGVSMAMQTKDIFSSGHRMPQMAMLNKFRKCRNYGAPNLKRLCKYALL